MNILKKTLKIKRDSLFFKTLLPFCRRAIIFIPYKDLHSCKIFTFIKKRNENMLDIWILYWKSFCMQVLETGYNQQHSFFVCLFASF